MSDLLFLVQRIPYPPTKGEKIRHYQFLNHLAKRFRVHLGCFIDDPADWLELAPLRRLCADAHFAPIDRRMGKVACLRGLLTGTPLSCTYFWSGELDAWVDQVLARVRPAGAKVYMDGKLVGTTPMLLASVPAGSHAIRIEHDGYRRWSSSVRVVASEQNRVTASLER